MENGDQDRLAPASSWSNPTAYLRSRYNLTVP